MTFPDPHDLPNALITHACGLTAASAAAELICAHGTWLTNPGFVDGYITTGIHASGQPYAYIHWDEVIAALNAHRIGGSGSAVWGAGRRQPRRPPHPRPPGLLPRQPRPHQHPPRHHRDHSSQRPPRSLNSGDTQGRKEKAPPIRIGRASPRRRSTMRPGRGPTAYDLPRRLQR